MHSLQPTMGRLQAPGMAVLQQITCCRGRAAQAVQQRSLLQVRGSYNIRGITPTDIPKLVLIEQQCQEFSTCWSAADITAELDNSLSRAAVAADAASDEPLGYIVCWLVAGELQVCWAWAFLDHNCLNCLKKLLADAAAISFVVPGIETRIAYCQATPRLLHHNMIRGLRCCLSALLQVLECAVDPALQSRGIGTALLQHMLATHRCARAMLLLRGLKANIVPFLLCPLQGLDVCRVLCKVLSGACADMRHRIDSSTAAMTYLFIAPLPASCTYIIDYRCCLPAATPKVLCWRSRLTTAGPFNSTHA